MKWPISIWLTETDFEVREATVLEMNYTPGRVQEYRRVDKPKRKPRAAGRKGKRR